MPDVIGLSVFNEPALLVTCERSRDRGAFGQSDELQPADAVESMEDAAVLGGMEAVQSLFADAVFWLKQQAAWNVRKWLERCGVSLLGSGEREAGPEPAEHRRQQQTEEHS